MAPGAALQPLQQPRLQETPSRLNEVAKLHLAAVDSAHDEQFEPEALGFEFTIEQIELRAWISKLISSPDGANEQL